jgi:hypothetical protein
VPFPSSNYYFTSYLHNFTVDLETNESWFMRITFFFFFIPCVTCLKVNFLFWICRVQHQDPRFPIDPLRQACTVELLRDCHGNGINLNSNICSSYIAKLFSAMLVDRPYLISWNILVTFPSRDPLSRDARRLKLSDCYHTRTSHFHTLSSCLCTIILSLPHRLTLHITHHSKFFRSIS